MWKLKLDANGAVVLQDGKPVYIRTDGSEFVADVPGMHEKLTTTANEARIHREAKEAAESKLASFKDIDVIAAKKALETVAALDAGSLMNAQQIGAKIAEVSAGYEAKLADKDKSIGDVTSKFQNTQKSNAFRSSKFVAEKLAVPVDMVEHTFGHNFEVNADGSIVAKVNGAPVYSRDKPGEIAGFEEALSIVVDGYAHKDSILKGGGGNGTGGTGGAGGGAGGKTITAAAFAALSSDPAAQGRMAREIAAGKVTQIP